MTAITFLLLGAVIALGFSLGRAVGFVLRPAVAVLLNFLEDIFGA